jgi:hypothetical protein
MQSLIHALTITASAQKLTAGITGAAAGMIAPRLTLSAPSGNAGAITLAGEVGDGASLAAGDQIILENVDPYYITALGTADDVLNIVGTLSDRGIL